MSARSLWLEISESFCPIDRLATNRHIPSNKPENIEKFCQTASGKPDPDPVLISACVPDIQPGFSLYIPHLTSMIVICRSSHHDDTIVKISFLPYLFVFSLPLLRYLIKCKFCYLINVIFSTWFRRDNPDYGEAVLIHHDGYAEAIWTWTSYDFENRKNCEVMATGWC